MTIRVRVDRQSCQGSGRCLAAAPAAFALDPDRLAEATAAAAALPLAQALEIARGCPALAIELFEPDGTPIEL